MHFMIRKIAKDMSVRKRNPEREKRNAVNEHIYETARSAIHEMWKQGSEGRGRGDLLDIVVESSHKRETFA